MAFKWLIWHDSVDAANCRRYIFHVPDAEAVLRTPPMKMSFVKVTNEFEYCFKFFARDNSSYEACLDESRLTYLLYTNKSVFSRFGKFFCLAYDVALGKGGSEAVVESLYSVMKAQSSQGGQSNEVLVNRTMVDWHCPVSPLGIMDFIDEAATLHEKTHHAPIAKLNFGMSKVMTRLKNDTGKIPNLA